MNGLNLEFNQFSITVNVVIRIITTVIFILYLFPLFVREAKVRNGLRILRYELLLTGSVIFLVNISGLFIILFKYLGVDVQSVTNFVTYFNTVGFLAYALLKLKIYTQRYSPENKKLHERFERIEVRELNKDKNRKSKK